MKNKTYPEIPAEKFRFASSSDHLHDKKLDTKPVGYFQDAFRRFCRNKGSVVAAIIICILVLFAIVGPYFTPKNFRDSYGSNKYMMQYKWLDPKLSFMEGTGFWDGTHVKEISQNTYYEYVGIAQETGYNPIQKVLDEYELADDFGKTKTMYKVRLNSYYALDAFIVQCTPELYQQLQDWQEETGIQLILPAVSNEVNATRLNIWYKVDGRQGNPVLDANGNLQPAYTTIKGSRPDDYNSTRLASDPYLTGDTENGWRYAVRSGAEGKYSYSVRVSAYNYFIYRYGYEPSFIFGTDSSGYDIISRLALGGRFSLMLAVCISAINLTIGAIYGAIEGYYGGVADMLMERFSDILANVPFMVVAILFNLHLAHKVGIVPALLFAFVLTGWIGMAARVRMQFYRFKNSEYVLAARTLGASDFRIMFKHIFPNSLGTIVTGSILVIPGVIFSETSLTYLGIIDLNSTSMTSIGSMLTGGKEVMTKAPHVVLFPAIFIALLMICFNLFGNGLRDAFNPSLRGTED